MKVSLKISCVIATFFILLLVLSTSVQAANEGLQIVKSGEDYIIYVEGYESTKFSFAFSNVKEPDMSTIKYYNNWTDSNGINVACLDNQSNIDLTNQIFIFITNEGNNMVISTGEIDLNQALSIESIEKVNNLTKRIPVDTTQTTTTNENIDGITKTKTSGKLVITDSQEYSYRYSLQKLTGASEADKLNNLLNDLNNSKSNTMVEKITSIKNVDETFNNLLNKASWQNVSEMTINQPTESSNGDMYAVLLQKLNSGNVVESDIQILKCSEIESQEKVTENIPVKYTSSLPITGENLALYITFGIIIILIVAVIVRIVFLKSNKKNESK